MTTRASKYLATWLLMALLCALPAWAGDDGDADVPPLRPTLSMFTVGVGHASTYDSYVSPLNHGGLGLSMGYEAMRATRFNPQHWLWQLAVGAEYDYTGNPAGNRHLHLLAGNFTFDMQHRWRDVGMQRLDLAVGPMMQLRGGVIYNPANSNNVVSVLARGSVGVTGMATYNTRCWRLPVTLRYQLQLPVLGVFFSPEYDESYYEIYLGNTRNLAHVGWWGNRLDMNHYLGADVHLGSTIVRVGYQCQFERSHVSNLHVHNVTHSLVVGIGGEFIGLGRKPRLADRDIVSPLY